jgi:hypothetical protein
MIWMRGGCASPDDAITDTNAWVARHGQPNWQSLLRWARENAIEADLVCRGTPEFSARIKRGGQ